MADKPHILVVDDDDRLRALIEEYLSSQDFYVTAAADAAAARQMLARFQFDALVLDVMMPRESGLALLSSLNAPRPPVLFLSARGEAEARIAGLEAGAEDYLAKPFEPRELVLRLRSLLRRAALAGPVRFGEYLFDTASMQLRQSGAPVSLTGGEAQLLKALAATPGQAVSREKLAQLLGGEARSVDVQITRLRKKIEANPAKPVYIQTLRGAGYLLAATAGASR